jgi:cellulose synthase/poly-beta-1,6-N-acetylglucosamine synthase-like glycosyltransferase
MSDVLNLGYKAVQGQRKPKNTDTTLSLLDGVSEAINNHIYRQGSVALGLSASINGSGVVFEYKLFKRKITTMTSIGGYDRELELLLLKEGVKVYYNEDACVYDEKVSQTHTFQNQRKRWISSQYHYLGKYFNEGMAALFKGDVTFFNSAILRNIQLPRLINIGLLTTLTFFFYFFKSELYFGYSIWIMLFTLNSFAILISIPKEYYSKKLISAIIQLPSLFIKMLVLMFKLKGANKKFIHTPHSVSSTNSK